MSGAEIKTGSVWRHKNGAGPYRVVDVANIGGSAVHAPSVVYRGGEKRSAMWVKTIVDFLEKMVPETADTKHAGKGDQRAGGAVMTLTPITLRAANAFVSAHHRHSAAVRGCVFCVSLVDDAGDLIGVAIAGRPLARMLCDGRTVEILRVCTLGHKNAPSKLYSACCRAAKAIGYRRVVTYLLARESGVSVTAAGFVVVAESPGGSWERAGRQSGVPLFTAFGVPDPRRQDQGPKMRWERAL